MGCGSVKTQSEKPSEQESVESSKKSKEKLKKSKKKKKTKKEVPKKKPKKIAPKKSSSENSKSKENDEKSSTEQYEIKLGRKMGKKDYRLNEQDKEDILKQDLKEAKKRQSRFVKFSKPKKEVEFNHQPEKEENNILDQPYSVGYEDEIHNGLNYGKPIRLFNQIWLTVDLPVEPDVYTPQVQIPPGWRVPTLKDYQELFDFCKNEKNSKIVLTHKKLLNMNKSFQYITLNKVHEDYFDGHFKNAWKFYCIAFNFEDEEEKKEKDKNDGVNLDIKIKKKKIVNDTIISEFEEKENEEKENDEEENDDNIPKGIKKSELINPDENDANMAFELNPFSMITKEEKKENSTENDNELKNKNKSEDDSDNDKKNKIKFKTADELHTILEKNVIKGPDNEIINNSSKKFIF